MLTLFTIPKPFIDHNGVIQRNALRSWRRMAPDCEILIFGNEVGTAEIAAEIGAHHIKDIRTNEYGTPFLDSIFREVEATARYDTLCYSNADMIYLPDFLSGIEDIKLERFLMVGRRWNVDIADEIDFHKEDLSEIRRLVSEKGKLYSIYGMDYFVFKKGTIGELPAFLVGRAGWDNWMIFNARKRQIPVIDGTCGFTAIHQNHDYNHVKRSLGGWRGPESDYNMNLLGGDEHVFSLHDATHVLENGQVLTNWSLNSIYRRIRTLLILNENLHALFLPFAIWLNRSDWLSNDVIGKIRRL